MDLNKLIKDTKSIMDDKGIEVDQAVKLLLVAAEKLSDIQNKLYSDAQVRHLNEPSALQWDKKPFLNKCSLTLKIFFLNGSENGWQRG